MVQKVLLLWDWPDCQKAASSVHIDSFTWIQKVCRKKGGLSLKAWLIAHSV